MTENNIKNKIIIFLTAVIVLNIAVSYFYIGYQHEITKDDPVTYVDAARFVQGEPVSGAEIMNRVLTVPLFLRSSVFINYFLGDLNLSISVVNVFFYILCVYAFYFLVLEIYKENRVAVLSTILFSFNYYIIDPVNAHLADMGGWFFFILATYLAVKYFNTSNKKYYYLSVLLSAVGVLFKEYGGFGVVNLALLILVSNIPFKQKIKDVLAAGLLFLIPLLSYHGFIYFKYHYSYFDWYKFVGTRILAPGYQARGLVLLIKILGWLFSFGWLAWLWGAWEEYKTMDKNRIKILLAILPVTIFFLVWPAYTQRIGVLFMIWLALIAGFGLSRMKWYFLYPLLIIYILFNYNILSLINIINLPF
jgi:hypothetical protein